MSEQYDAEFYKRVRSGCASSAGVVVPLLMELVHPQSVVDVGCGDGTWLSMFERHGVRDYLGFDGDYVDRSVLAIPADRFSARDLNATIDAGRRFDLVISFEVAEHLRPESADHFVCSLVSLGDVVAFSAAPPRQGGRRHLNEQWPEYWCRKFVAQGYEALDIIRPRIWTDARVKWWYRQNTVLYVRRASLERFPKLRCGLAGLDGVVLPLVHPRKLEEVEGERTRPGRLVDEWVRRLRPWLGR